MGTRTEILRTSFVDGPREEANDRKTRERRMPIPLLFELDVVLSVRLKKNVISELWLYRFCADLKMSLLSCGKYFEGVVLNSGDFINTSSAH